jgi:hypothetical protein
VFSTMVIQNGPVRENGVNGDQIDDILRFVVDRLREFSQPPHDNDDTAVAIELCEGALYRLAKRTAEREARGVEGTSQP